MFVRSRSFKSGLVGLSCALSVAACGSGLDEAASDTEASETGADASDTSNTNAEPSGTSAADGGSIGPVDDDDGGGTGTAGTTSSTEQPTEGSGDTTTGGEPLPPYDTSVEWTPCPLYTYGQGTGADCADIEVPLDWTDPAGPRIDVFVKRIGNPEGDKQLWMLMGGPGAPGSGYEADAESFVNADPELVVYLPDHRGVGRSARLGCSVQEAAASEEGPSISPSEWPACLDDLQQTWGDGLAQFTTSNAARDVGWMSNKLRGDQDVHIYGASYGTYWGHRFAQLYPDGAQSLTLLGIAPPGFNFARFTEQYDEVGRAFIASCSDDPLCASKLGPDAESTMEEIMNQVDDGLCPEALAAGLDRQTLKVFFSSRLSWSWSERALVPAILYRLQRCNAQDAAVLVAAAPSMLNALAGVVGDPYFSPVLNNHVSISELWFPPIPTVQESQAAADAALFGLGSTERRVVLAPMWPAYEQDEYASEYAELDIPMLMLVGEFDPNSPKDLGQEFAEQFSGPNQHFLEIPDGMHGWESPTDEGYGCAINVFFNFIQDPTGPTLDCMGIVTPLNFGGDPGLSESFFGTLDLYEN